MTKKAEFWCVFGEIYQNRQYYLDKRNLEFMKKLFTSESVTEGHPDKICDNISDAVLDAVLSIDPMARVACETSVCPGFVLVMGEITTTAQVDVEGIVREVVRDIGYVDDASGFSANNVEVLVKLNTQSPDIAMGVDNATDNLGLCTSEQDCRYDTVGAGDQGMMFGYATSETESYMPVAIYYAHKLSAKITEVRKNGTLPYLRPDGKSQVTCEYVDGVFSRVDTVVVSCQHSEDVTQDKIKQDIKKYVIDEVIPSNLMDSDTKIYINPTGRFVVGGPESDSGLTGRKIIVDTYGGYCAHGGGAFSGKDPTKVDRSAAYMARYVCKNIVASGLAKTCEMEVAYAIGRARPVSIMLNTFGSGILSDEDLTKVVTEVFDMRPGAIIDHLELRRPIYRQTASYGHFGKDNLSWERIDKVSQILEVSKKYM